jgi:hypothetical protein
MIGVTLGYKWITWAMFMGPGLEPASYQGGFTKCIHMTWIWAVTKNTVRCALFKKKERLGSDDRRHFGPIGVPSVLPDEIP